ncbi:MAG: beta-N-acetylglucosaminidase domain-containing protein [Proteobacteria bacterium]|nr:beta-N-acetylglucosaminidase domain-containing protein [Pseudomonadota bacterium]
MFAGVIEGFFGNAWGFAARRDAAEFLARAGYHFYLYAPKSDPWLRRRWREPIPAERAAEFAALAAHCRARNLAFGVGLTPFEVFRDYDDTARADLRRKVAQLDELGCEVLCILFDDMRGDLPRLAQLQVRIVDDITSWSTARRYIFCPTYYSYDALLARAFGAPPPDYLADIGRLIDSRIEIFWTGEVVCSDCYPRGHLDEVAELLRRRPFIWDNNIANDARKRCARLFLSPDRGRWELDPAAVAGIAINPMNQAYLSQVALCGYAKLLGLRGVTEQDCLALCGEPVAGLLRDRRPLVEEQGLEAFEPAERERWVAMLRAAAGDPYAAELLAWLNGEYRFDPACLTE